MNLARWPVALCSAACTASATEPDLTLALDVDHPATVLASLPDSEARDCSVSWTAPASAASLSGAAVLAAGAPAVLAGAPAGSEVEVKADCLDSRGVTAETTRSITTGGVPSSVPLLRPVEGAPDLDEPYILTAAIELPEGAAVSIGTPEGEPVWWETLEPDHIMSHPHYDPVDQLVFGVETSADGQYNSFVRAGLAGPTERWDAGDAHHDSVDLGGGTYLLSVGERQEVDGEAVEGDDLVVFDVADASSTVVWRAFDELPIVRNDGWDLRTPDGAADWTHVNGLYLDPDTRKVYASLYYDRSIVQIDVETWETELVIGGPNSDFAVTPEFGPQHSPVHVGDSLWMFDNGADVAAGSRLAQYTLDETAMTATQVWSWQPDGAPFNVVLGSIALADDAVLASWGDTGEARVLDPGGDVLGSYDMDDGLQVGFTSFITAL